ncbi:MAG: shikimate dehydrogenase [Firmicutes bacterium]|jgi:shikimate dehydrogenase|nr:shikimate dehydrogenase [Bacillota bacterium]
MDKDIHMHMIDARTTMYALLGSPVRHSLSPIMHNAAFRALGINAAYMACEVAPGELADAIEGARALSFGGLNITSPYKEAVIENIDIVSPAAALIRSVNTVVREGDAWRGYSTDGAGLCRFLQGDSGAAAADPTGRRVLIVGAGGAARAVAFALAQEGVKSLTVANRTPAHAEELKELISVHTSFHATRTIPLEEEPLSEELDRSSLIIYCLAFDHDVLKEILSARREEEGILSGRTLVDLRYVPAETETMRLFRLSGGEAFNGKGMLLWQGVLAFELFMAKAKMGAPVEAMRRAIELQ